MAQRGVDYESLPGSLSSMPKHPLSKSWSRSVSSRAMSERGPQSPSLRTQASSLRSSQNPDYHMPQQPPTTKTLFSLQTTPSVDRPPPPSPIAKAKFMSRSLTFSSFGSKIGRALHSDSHFSDPSPSKPTSSGESSSPEIDVPGPAQADGPAVVVKPLFRSSTFRDQAQNAAHPLPDPAPSQAKPFFRSSSFAHKEQGFSIARSLSRSLSSLSSHDQEKEPGFKADSFSGISKWARSFRSKAAAAETDIPESSPYSLFSGSPSSKRASSRVFPIDELESSLGVLTKGFLDSSKNAVKAVHDKARHLVSQNSQRYQDGGLHLDMVYITESVIAVGFPGANTGSSILGFMEANYQDLMEGLITFCEAEHPSRYKIFNPCSETLYDTSLLHDKVACFPFQGSNCPPLKLVSAFCEAAYAWLKEGLENVVVVQSKGGMARSGLMISCLLLHLKFYPTAEESINHYNHKRSMDSNALNLPSQLRYVKYYETVLRKYHGSTPTGRRCALRSIRLFNCPAWIRPAVTVSDHDGVLFRSIKHPDTRSMLTEDLWLSAIRKGELVFELPLDGRAATVDGDFKLQFQCYHVDFACWLNTNLMEETIVLQAEDLDGFDKEAAGFHVELDLVDIGSPTRARDAAPTGLRYSSPSDSAAAGRASSFTDPFADDEIKLFSDSEGEEEETAGMPPSPSPSIEKRETRARDCNSPPFAGHASFPATLLNAAMDRLGVTTHLRSFTKSASMPNSRHLSPDRGTPGSARRAADHSWSSRFQSSKAEKPGFFEFKRDYNDDDDDVIATISYIPGKVIVSGALNPPLPEKEPAAAGVSFGSEEEPRCEPSSEFQALAAARAADASLFSFVDDDDYESDEV